MQNGPVCLEGITPVQSSHIVKASTPSRAFEKMGVLILAGGQGTRLGFDGPKGCFELNLKKKKSLFEILFEKVKAKGDHLSIAIMTSPINHDETLAFFEKNSWFGYSKEGIDFFQQELMPTCDEEGNVFLESPNQIAQAPAGNGKALFHLQSSPIWEKWRAKKIECIQVIPVDNPLADPFDGELLSCHETAKVDLALKCIERGDPQEKLGVLVTKQGRLVVQEYSELSEEVKKEHLVFSLGHSGLFSCSMDFIEHLVSESFSMPWHLAHKKGNRAFLASDGWQAEEIWAWKFETFIFDIFPHTSSYQVVIGDRKKCFAPLKNLIGPDSPETVVRALSACGYH